MTRPLFHAYTLKNLCHLPGDWTFHLEKKHVVWEWADRKATEQAKADAEGKSTETGVMSENLRYIGAFKKGTEVEANFEGQGEWLKAKITKAPKVNKHTKEHAPPTYDLEYDGDDGKKEKDVAGENIRALPTSYKKRTKVEAKVGGEGDVWYTGKIVKVNDNGPTFDVEYDTTNFYNLEHAMVLANNLEQAIDAKTWDMAGLLTLLPTAL